MCLSDYFSLSLSLSLVSPSAPNPLFDISLYSVHIRVHECVGKGEAHVCVFVCSATPQEWCDFLLRARVFQVGHFSEEG